MRAAGGLLDEVRLEHVQRELKLTPAQVEKVADLAANGPRVDMTDLFRRMQNSTPDQFATFAEELRGKREEVRKAQDVKMKEILSPEQLSRAEQLVLQDLGPSALNRAEVAQKVGLSDDQKQRVASIIQTAEQQTRALGRQASQVEREKITAGRDAGILETLSEEQKQVWKTSLGPPREVPPARVAPARPWNPRGPGVPPPPSARLGRSYPSAPI